MLAELAAALQAREETIEFAGQKLLVRELETAADVAAFQQAEDLQLKLVVRCVFDLQGAPVFTDEDIPELRRTSKKRFAPLLAAVNRVNGFDVDDSTKNSEAAPA